MHSREGCDGWQCHAPRTLLPSQTARDATPPEPPRDANRKVTEDALSLLSQRDREVLEEIATGDDTQVGFQGIKRRLELHPEALRRALKRLRADGYVEKRDFGYALTDTGHTLLAGRGGDVHDAVRPIPVAGLLLPSHVTPDRVVEVLARRWFDGLHWYGLAQGMGEATLTWLTEHGSDPVRLRVGMGRVRIEAALRDAGTDTGLAAAAPLVAAVAALLRARRTDDAAVAS